ncbi:MAG: nuclear transport factor 2 family protein [Acidimicrobiaceae bacterium]|nr:nuclear transport factor 2 family protein [Acidimicrobiaceae bacterium]
MGGSAEIETRLQRLEDLAEIRRLIQGYRRYLDDRDLDAYSRLFAEDGEWLGGTGYGKGPGGIAAMLKEHLPANPPAPGPTTWHVVPEPEIDVRGDTAVGAVTWLLAGRGEGDVPGLRMLGHYDDTYVRVGGGWRFRRRVAQTDIPHLHLDIPDEWRAAQARAAEDIAGARPAASPEAGDDLGRRLRCLEAEEEIRHLLLEYKTVLDRQDFQAYAGLFTEDGEFGAGRNPAKGRAAIQALVESMPGTLLGSAPGEDFHVVVNPQIELDADDLDRARARSVWLYVVRGAHDTPVLAKMGHYEDDLVRQEGRWWFQRRRALSDIPAT